MKKYSLLFAAAIALINYSPCAAQEFSNDYVPLVSSGKLPDDFVVSASSKAQKDIEKLKKKGDQKSKDKIRFIVSNTFFIDNVLKSGKVLYGDPIGKYAAKVADEVLKSDPATRAKLRFYIVKSPVVNAFAFDNGIIMITTGLISQLENEAQLAFVLSHEIVHFKSKHSISAHLEFVGKEKKKRSFNRNGTNLLLEKSKFSKKQESQADEEGFKIFATTGYSYKSIDGLFDVLQYSYLPFEDVEFDKRYFNDQYLRIPDGYYLDKVKDINADDNYNDSLSSHPNIRKRREKIENLTSGAADAGRKEFIVSKEEFERVRELSRFETCRMYMQDLDYPEAIYSAYALLKRYPNNIFLKKTIAYSLYEVASYKSLYNNYLYEYTFKNGVTSYYKKRIKSRVERAIAFVDSIQGSSQQVFALLNKLSPMEATVLALHNNWKLNQHQGYSDPYTLEVCDSLMMIMAWKYQAKLEDFSKTARVITPDTAKAPVDAKAQSKYEKIRKKSKNKITDDSFCKYAFVDMLNDKRFVSSFSEMSSLAKKRKKAAAEPATAKAKTKTKKKTDDVDDDTANESSEPDSVKAERSEVEARRAANEKEYNELLKFKKLGIDNIVVVDPSFMKLDQRKKDQVQYFSGDDRLKYFSKLMEENAKLLRLECTMLCPSTFSEDDVESYNGFTYINDWISEKLMHGSFDNAMVLNRDFKTYLQKKYGTKYFLWTGVVGLRKKKNMGAMVALTFFVPYLVPYTLAYMFSQPADTYYYAALFNIETERLELFQEHEIDMKDKRCVLNSMIYDTFFQIKKGNKK